MHTVGKQTAPRSTASSSHGRSPTGGAHGEAEPRSPGGRALLNAAWAFAGALCWTSCTSVSKDATQYPATGICGTGVKTAGRLCRTHSSNDQGNHVRLHSPDRTSTGGCAVRHHPAGSRETARTRHQPLAPATTTAPPAPSSRNQLRPLRSPPRRGPAVTAVRRR